MHAVKVSVTFCASAKREKPQTIPFQDGCGGLPEDRGVGARIVTTSILMSGQRFGRLAQVGALYGESFGLSTQADGLFRQVSEDSPAPFTISMLRVFTE